MATTQAVGQQVRSATLTDSKVASANIDGVAGTASLRTLGTGAQQACAGNDSRIPTQAVNSGSSPTFAALTVTGSFTCAADTQALWSAVAHTGYLS